MARFTVAAASARNDLDNIWFTGGQPYILTKLADALYNAVPFYKHRSEGETNSNFAYIPEDVRVKAYRKCREILSALDIIWRTQPKLACVINFLHFFDRPIQMLIRRYRFVEESLTISRPETDALISQALQNVNLWNRVEASKRVMTDGRSRYKDLINRSHELMFPGLAEFLDTGGDGHCDHCRYRGSYGTQESRQFGGVQLCNDCRIV